MSDQEFLNLCTQSGIRLDADGENLRIRAPKGVMTESLRTQITQRKAALIELLRAAGGENGTPSITPDLTQRYEPFPLTDIQQAYVIGRKSSYSLGGPCMIYVEFGSRALDLARLERAWQRMVTHHDMLRAVIRADFQQQIRRPEEVAPYRIKVMDLSALSEDQRQARLAATRAQLTEGIKSLDEEPLFDIQASLLPGGELRLHFAFDLLLADAASIKTLFTEWGQFYADLERRVPPLSLSFRDYVLAEQAARSGPQWQRHLAYWEGRAATLPNGPELPLLREPAALSATRIRRLSAHLPKEVWQRLRAAAAAAEITPSMALCAAWAEVLACWGRSEHFLLNLTLFQRLPLHPEVNSLLADFTSTLLLERDGIGASFRARAQRLSEQFGRDLMHSPVSGIQVQRLRARTGSSAQLAPLVFTSMLGNWRDSAHDPFGWSFLGELVHMASRTPQVWIDHQVLEDKGQLMLVWDAAAELFPQGMLDDMFAAYQDLLYRLADSDAAWQSEFVVALPAAQSAQRADRNATLAPYPAETLFAGFLRHATVHPGDVAILSPERELGYGELERLSRVLANHLVMQGAAAEHLVAIVLPKGWEQVVAALAVVRSGAAYLPIDPELPPDRIALLLRSGEVSLAITSAALDAQMRWPTAVMRLLVDGAPPEVELALPEVSPEQLAYVIYTSGSTGQPKGVMIEHRAAVNTIIDVNQRLGIGRGDRVLALSALSFDLSVYDIFGMLAAGGALVLTSASETRDPTAWVPLMRSAGVTVWNSVPALLEILVDYVGGRADLLPATLRVVMLSGDWIPVTLPDRLRALVPAAQVISLGGATEASIWSIYYPIDKVSPDWRSVPYGRPLQNQRFAVLDARLYDRPVWATGELYIGGDGLARGYFGDAERTRERFIVHPRSGERLYRTGDLGRYFPDGDIEFLGRNDTQIKLRGFRIELGEIEAALSQHPAVAACAVVPEGPARAPNQLVAFVVPRGEPSGGQPGSSLPELATVLAAKSAAPPDPDSHVKSERLNALITRLAVSYMSSALRSLGAFAKPSVLWTEDALMALGVIPRLRKWLRRTLELLTEAGKLQKSAGGEWLALTTLEPELVEPLWTEIFAESPELSAELGLLQRSGESMAAILIGAVQAVEALFPKGADDAAQQIYQSSAFTESNRACRDVVSALAEGAGTLRILELGAGVGSTTQHILPVLPAARTSYVYTDISRYFLELGQKQFCAFPFLSYQLLDGERDFREQGLTAGTFDVVVASSVLHATRDIRQTLQNARMVMRTGGVLLMIEETRFLPLHNATMGLQQGFDRAEDTALRPRHPLLTPDQWRVMLADTGFTEIAVLAPQDPWAVLLGVVVIMARAPATLHPAEEASVMAHLGARLPAYMVPAALVSLPALPLSANGKVDRGALVKLGEAARSGASAAAPHAGQTPDADKARERRRAEFVKPHTPFETSLAALWKTVLGGGPYGANDDFLLVGGDSLLGARLLSHIEKDFGVTVSMQELYEDRSLAELALLIEERVLERALLDPDAASPAGYASGATE